MLSLLHTVVKTAKNPNFSLTVHEIGKTDRLGIIIAIKHVIKQALIAP